MKIGNIEIGYVEKIYIPIIIEVLSIILLICGFKYIEETTLFYYFSTTAQTLGALMGVVGAFSIFKIQRLEQDIVNKVKSYYDELHNIVMKHNFKEDPETIAIKNLYNLLANYVKEFEVNEIINESHKILHSLTGNDYDALGKEFSDLFDIYTYRNNIKNHLITATIPSMVLIFLCIIFILTTKVLLIVAFWKFTTILLTLLLLGITLSFIYVLIEKLIKE